MRWVKQHKFWASVIILFLLVVVFSFAGGDAFYLGCLVGLYLGFGLMIKGLLSCFHKRGGKKDD